MQPTRPLVLPKNATQLFIEGPVGSLDCLCLKPNLPPKGAAIVFHPDPKGGGSYTNKIVQTLAKALNNKGYVCYCPNLRGVGMSAGEHDYGVGEIEDAKSVYNYVTNSWPDVQLVLAGFSFGCAIASGLAHQSMHSKLILIAPAVTRYTVYVPDNARTIVVHGEQDEIIPLDNVYKWAKLHEQNIIWCPDTGHFFHGKLVSLANILNNLEL